MFMSVYSIDATGCHKRLGRFLNDAPRKHANARAKVIEIDGIPHIILLATRVININEEIRFDYGVADAPWRMVIICC